MKNGTLEIWRKWQPTPLLRARSGHKWTALFYGNCTGLNTAEVLLACIADFENTETGKEINT